MLVFAAIIFTTALFAQPAEQLKKLKGFDQYMEKLLKDWNIAGAGVGIVYKNTLIYAKGYGYRDFEKKLPVTPSTLYQIASNTKLFTAISVGFMVDQGKLEWDQPVKKYIPSINFYNDYLDNTITIRDMLSHRTGISRHDLIWFKSDFSRKQLFDRLKYLEPSQAPRTGMLYNNLMYVSAGYILELLSSKTWEDFLRTNIFSPLDMKSTVFTVSEMEANPDHGVPFNERRDTNILYRIPIYSDQDAVGPAGSIISNIEDMSHWMIALMNGGKYNGIQVIPEKTIKATLQPSIAMPNSSLENKGWSEMLNSVYGMGRWTAAYRGHLIAFHGGDLPGFHSQFSMMPYDSIGVITFIIGDQGQPLYNIISYNVYERLLGMDLTPWSERVLKDVKISKKAGTEGRSKAGSDRVTGTRPSHPLDEYAGTYENPAYGLFTISRKDTALQIDFHNIKLPLYHYHFDRFDTPNDEEYGLFSLNFRTNPQGNIESFLISFDENQTSFIKKPDTRLTDPAVLTLYTGKYELAGSFISVELTDGTLFLSAAGQPRIELIPVKDKVFVLKPFPDTRVVFVEEAGKITGLKQVDPSGAYLIKKVR